MNQAVKIGALTGVVSVIFMLAMIFASRGSATAFLQYAALLSFLAGTYIAIKRTRDLELGGSLSFKLGLKAGVSAGTVAAIIMSAFQFFAWTHIDVKEWMSEMKVHGGTNEDILPQLRAMTNSNFLKATSMLLCINIIIALFVSVAGSVLLRKRGGLLNE